MCHLSLLCELPIRFLPPQYLCPQYSVISLVLQMGDLIFYFSADFQMYVVSLDLSPSLLFGKFFNMYL